LKASNATSSRNRPRAEPSRNDPSSSSTADRFALEGPSLLLDERIHAFRRDIADIALAGQIVAPHYARPLIRVAAASACAVYKGEDRGSEILSELRPGDEFAVLDLSGGWAWGYRRLNHHVGYVPETDLARPDAQE
jgi:hypothetical protein